MDCFKGDPNGRWGAGDGGFGMVEELPAALPVEQAEGEPGTEDRAQEDDSGCAQ